MDIAYIAGFFDGECSINITGSTLTLSASIGNLYLPVLETLKETFGGNISLSCLQASTRRSHWAWTLWGHSAYSLLVLLRPFLVVKYTQTGIAIDFEESLSQRKECHSRLDEVILRRRFTYKLLLEASRNSWTSKTIGSETWFDSYAGGFFDAEGSITVDGRGVDVTIGNTCPTILEDFRKHFGGSLNVYNGMNLWGIHSKSAIGFLSTIKPYTLVKAQEIDIVLEHNKNFPFLGKGFVPSAEGQASLFSCKLRLIDLHNKLNYPLGPSK